MITIVLNGKTRDLEASVSLPALLELLGVNPQQVAIAVNGDVVPRRDWSKVTVRDGDRIEIVRAVGGG
jgi:sulfur carrier protein